MSIIYVDCEGRPQTLTEYHLHELIDRTDCVRRMIEELLQNHPASGLIDFDLERVQLILGQAYQKLGDTSFREFGE